MKHKIKVVMLPTEDKTSLIVNNHLATKSNLEYRPDLLKASAIIRSAITYQYVYITVLQDREPIKEGDWFVDVNVGGLAKCDSEDIKTINVNTSPARKIIATTDPILTTESELDAYYRNGLGGAKNIPQVQQSFLKEFVANPDGEYEVEYNDGCKCYDNDIKLNQDNTVNITSVEEKMYSREDVVSLLNKLNEQLNIVEEVQYNGELTLEDWIKENL
tara:strand:+ start:784 stop:1434 length:651 start_codon:yes stop_codon:yes gene_type:complete